MTLTEWEVWLTYSMYLSGGVPKLHEAARDLVEFGLASVASTSDGFAAFRSGAEVKTGQLGVAVTPDNREARVTLPEGASGFELEGLIQTAMMRFSEARLFTEESPVLPPYLRVQLDECWSHSVGSATRFYPSVKLYKNGVILVELRMFSPEQPVALAPFIDNIINKYAQPIERFETGIGLAALLPRSVLLSEGPSLWDRLRLSSALRRLERRVGDRTRSSDSASAPVP